MGKISLSTNIDLQNYEYRTGEIARHMNPLGIEIFSVPENYPSDSQLELSENEESSGYALLSKRLAQNIGRRIGRHGMKRIQFHYPFQKSLLDRNGTDIARTIQFCDIILDESGAEQMTINYHSILKYPISLVSGLSKEDRQDVIRKLETDERIVKRTRDDLKSPSLIVVENNPAASGHFSEAEGSFDNIDYVPEDYVSRQWIDGTTLDYGHAWSVVSYFKGEATCPSLEWCRRQYGGIPKSAESLESFIEAAAEKIRWIHLSDESTAYLHQGLHIGDGTIDFNECAHLLQDSIHEEAVATIEVKDGHTHDGFRKIIEHDYPKLSKLFG